MRKTAASLWPLMRREARAQQAQNPLLASYLYASIVGHKSFSDSLCFVLANKLAEPSLGAVQFWELFSIAHAKDQRLALDAQKDLAATIARDPAAKTVIQAFLYFKGFHALQAHRIAHALWREKREILALHLQSRISEVFGVDIHPGARIGAGIMMDHATGIVIGETAMIGNDVSLMHDVTLGGTGNESGDRHPKIGDGVLLGAGARVLGNIRIGDRAKVAAGSVVLEDVPPHATVAGVPARIVGKAHGIPAKDMDQTLDE